MNKDKRPQPTTVLVQRLRRVAKSIDRLLEEDWAGTSNRASWKARANTCWQAAARLELLTAADAATCEGCARVATTEDDAGVPLCDVCFADLNPSI